VLRVLPALLLAAAACTSGHAPIRIGLAGPLTDSVGAPMKRAADLAVQEINDAGGINGRPIELVSRNDYGSADSAVTVATELAESGVVAVIGHVYSGTTLSAAPVYNAAKVVEISPSSSSPLITDAGPYTFRVCPSDLQQGAALARFAAEQLGLHRGAILYINDEYGRGLRQTFASEFSRLGGVIDQVEPYLGDRPDVAPYLELLARRGTSQFVFIGGNLSEAEEALRLARARGIKVPFLGGDGLEGLEAAGALAEGSYISNGYLPSLDTPKNRAFLRAYQRRYPGAAPPSHAAVATYDIMYLLRRVIGSAGVSRERVRDAVAAIGRTTPPFEGVTGEIAFDENGDAVHPRIVIGRIEAGQVRAVEGL
jgi:branched-chain amino acid transport system substrate-binding protein